MTRALRRDAQPHGRAAWLRGRCRCTKCRSAVLTYSRERDAARALTRGAEPATRVSPDRVRRHIERLRAEGWSLSQIGRSAGVNRTTVDRLTHGYLRRCSRITARLVLAVDGPPP